MTDDEDEHVPVWDDDVPEVIDAFEDGVLRTDRYQIAQPPDADPEHDPGASWSWDSGEETRTADIDQYSGATGTFTSPTTVTAPLSSEQISRINDQLKSLNEHLSDVLSTAVDLQITMANDGSLNVETNEDDEDETDGIDAATDAFTTREELERTGLNFTTPDGDDSE